MTLTALTSWPYLLTNDSVHDSLTEEYIAPWCLYCYHLFTVFQEIQQYNNILHIVSSSDAEPLVHICPSSLVKLKHICIKYNFKKKSLSHTCIRSHHKANLSTVSILQETLPFIYVYMSLKEIPGDKIQQMETTQTAIYSSIISKHFRISRGCHSVQSHVLFINCLKKIF